MYGRKDPSLETGSSIERPAGKSIGDRDEPMIQRLMMNLEVGVKEYAEVLNVAERKLSPVLKSIPESGADSQSGISQSMSPLAGTLAEFVNRIDAMNARLREIVNRLEL